VGDIGWMPWRTALVVAIALAVITLVLHFSRRTKRASALIGQIALLFGLYAAWQYAGTISLAGLDSAHEAGVWIAHLEEFLRWPDEAAFQALVLNTEWLGRAADIYYIVMHVSAFLFTLGWVLILHRPDWPFVRTTVILLTGACLLIQYIPVAPPRLIPELGVVDTAARNDLSVYSAVPGANQFAAMPSVHMAWASAVALIIIVVARTRWRWLSLAYPIATLWVVVVTGNHFLLDAVVAVLLLGAARAVTLAFPSQRPTRMKSRLGGEARRREDDDPGEALVGGEIDGAVVGTSTGA